MIAELFLDTSGARGFAELAQRAQSYFEIDKEGSVSCSARSAG